jgi:hypothetical protein
VKSSSLHPLWGLWLPAARAALWLPAHDAAAPAAYLAARRFAGKIDP